MSTLKITFDKSAMADNGQTKVNIGFIGTGSVTKTDGTVLKFIDEGCPETGGFAGNWYTYSDLSAGVETSNFSGRVYVCYNGAWAPQSAGYEPSSISPSDPNFNIRYDKFEMTFDGSVYSCADLTAIDFWAIPMSLKSTKGGAKVSEILGVKPGSSNNDIYTALKGLSNPIQSTATATELTKEFKAAGMNPPALIPVSGVVMNGSDFVRVIGPNSYPPFGNPQKKQMMGLPFTPYNTFMDYLNYLITTFGPSTTKGSTITGLGQGKIATLSGHYAGKGKNPTTNITKPQDYNLDVTIDNDMNITLTGSGTVAGTIEMHFSKWDLLNPAGMYGGNAKFSLGSSTTTQSPENDIYAWLCGDLFAGFNIGAIGCATKVNNNVVGTLPSSEWFSNLNSGNMFGHLWPNHANFYNQWAAELVTRSDAYNFAYAERFSAPQLNLNPANVDTLVVEFLNIDVTNATAPVQLAATV